MRGMNGGMACHSNTVLLVLFVGYIIIRVYIDLDNRRETMTCVTVGVAWLVSFLIGSRKLVRSQCIGGEMQVVLILLYLFIFICSLYFAVDTLRLHTVQNLIVSYTVTHMLHGKQNKHIFIIILYIWNSHSRTLQHYHFCRLKYQYHGSA